MQITPDYCRLMARYNQWQNAGLRTGIDALPLAELDRDRGAFFGSIRRTLNHILWADLTWMHRFAGSAKPLPAGQGGVDLTPTAAVWGAERFRTDAAIILWADRLTAVDLVGDLSWYSGLLGRNEVRPIQPLIVHMFNHQTHHRGQVHAMLTAAGITPLVTDLFLMPQ